MIFIAFALLLLILAMFVLSFLEAGAFLCLASGSDDTGKGIPTPVNVGTVVACIVLFRAQVSTVLAVWVGSRLYSLVEGNDVPMGVLSAVLSAAIIFSEIAGKLIAIRHPDHARRKARPLHRLLARFRPRVFWFGG